MYEPYAHAWILTCVHARIPTCVVSEALDGEVQVSHICIQIGLLMICVEGMILKHIDPGILTCVDARILTCVVSVALDGEVQVSHMRPHRTLTDLCRRDDTEANRSRDTDLRRR